MQKRIMILFIIVPLFIIESQCEEIQTLTTRLRPNHAAVAKFFDAEHRGEEWYSYQTQSRSSEELDTDGSNSEKSSLYSEADKVTTSDSSEASSAKTSKERREHAIITHRTCKACPQDMLKKWKNRGIKWICGTYQRARRTFKSECMMRYRNCEDGTMFVKSADHRCRNNTFHGRHWFYVYKV